MNKNILVFILLIAVFINLSRAQKIDRDTIRIDFFIATGEFGGVNEGLIISYSTCGIKAQYIRYNTSSYGILLNSDAIINFYNKNRDDYSILKSEWALTKQQQNYIDTLICEIKNYNTKGFSNAAEHYVISSNKQDYVLIDSTGQWDKFLEIRKTLGVEKNHKNKKAVLK